VPAKVRLSLHSSFSHVATSCASHSADRAASDSTASKGHVSGDAEIDAWPEPLLHDSPLGVRIRRPGGLASSIAGESSHTTYAPPSLVWAVNLPRDRARSVPHSSPENHEVVSEGLKAVASKTLALGWGLSGAAGRRGRKSGVDARPTIYAFMQADLCHCVACCAGTLTTVFQSSPSDSTRNQSSNLSRRSSHVLMRPCPHNAPPVP
jgi:hypothetical protein